MEPEKQIKLQVGVKVFLQSKEKKFLLLKRSPVRYPNIKDCWDVPGGRIIPGTPLIENLRREVKEETSLEIKGEIRLVAAQDIIRGTEKHIVRITYQAKADGKPVLSSEEVDFRWLTLQEMKEWTELDNYSKEVLLSGVIHET